MQTLFARNKPVIFGNDANGNMTRRTIGNVVWTYEYDSENHLVETKENGQTENRYLYDGDGNRVARLDANDEGTIFIGNYFEARYPAEEELTSLFFDCAPEGSYCTYLPIVGNAEVNELFTEKPGVSYYYSGNQRIAMRIGGEAYLLFGDHLGSSSLLVKADGTIAEKAYYLPWGGERGNTSITSTDYGYTGQMKEGDIYYYGARWYDPSIGRFMQADTIVPLNVQGTQAFDRYAYVNSNPLRYTDPSGLHIGVNYRMTDGGADGYPVIIDYMLMRLEEDYGSLTNDYNAILETYGQYAYNHPGLFFYEGANVIKTFLVNSDYGKPYDLKEALNEFFFPGEDNRRKYTLIDEYYYFFDIWGNMYYGYMGARLGLPKEVLLQGAGWAQQRNDNPAVIRNQNAFMYKKYDYPTDQAAISKGYDLWKEYGGSITPQNVLDVLDVTLDRLPVLP